ncbi:MAG: glucokinase [Pseudomonadota bacterium]|nr:glucokinase [Pseudomonadota bacterium]
MNILAGDVGGTKVLLQLCEIGGALRVIATRSYSSRRYDELASIITQFLAEASKDAEPPAAACFAVAGPVRDQKAKVTNLPWMLDAQQLAAALGMKHVLLVNDMHGVGYGIGTLGVADLEVLQAGEPETGGTRVIIAAGTGLGQGAMVWQQDRYVMLTTEGGHADFAPRDELEIDLLRYLLARHGQVSCEMLLSGRGLMRIYEFLRDNKRVAQPAWLAEALHEAIDPAAVISTAALDVDPPAIAVLALDCFIRAYGAQAGNLALTFLATGGVYIAGGIALKIATALRSGAFIQAFKRNATMQALLEKVPVSIIKTPEVCLLGARQLAINLMELPGA